MTTLTAVALNKYRPETAKFLKNRNDIHGAVKACFTQETMDKFNKITGRELYSVDFSGKDPVIYISSPVLPDVSHIVEQYGRPADENSHVSGYIDPFIDSISGGDVLKFRVDMDTITRTGRDDNPIHPNDLQNWFTRKAENNGFTVNELGFQVTKFTKKGNVEKSVNARFFGILTVKDLENFKSVVKNGLGRGKTYGLGLLHLSKP